MIFQISFKVESSYFVSLKKSINDYRNFNEKDINEIRNRAFDQKLNLNFSSFPTETDVDQKRSNLFCLRSWSRSNLIKFIDLRSQSNEISIKKNDKIKIHWPSNNQFLCFNNLKNRFLFLRILWFSKFFFINKFRWNRLVNVFFFFLHSPTSISISNFIQKKNNKR